MTHVRETGATELFDVVSIGETMVAFVAHDDLRHYRAIPAGAESNVAVGMAQLGCRARWVSRLGDDPLGRLVEESIAAGGVDVAAVRDGARPTGVMTKHLSGAGTVARYYRSESAARTLSVDDLGRTGRARWMHVTGITAALSASAADLVEAVVDRRTGHDGRVAFDFNLRPVLWPDTATAADLLLALSRRADVVFIGDDEAATLFGTREPAELAGLILRRAAQELVLKRGADGASVISGDGEVSEPALPADVIDVTGAGDAFAAGYLAAATFGWPVRARLRLGHLMGSRVVGVLDDIPPPFTPAELEALSPAALASRWAAIPITNEQSPA
jgi:2-dehydro-3-deoxygluconokinase